MTAISNRLDRLRERRTDRTSGSVQIKEASLRKAYWAPSAKEAREYMVEAAEAVDAPYTKKTFEECERVQKQLEAGLIQRAIPVEFEHQGSTSNNTHIRLYSDIDLLSVTGKFTFVKPPAQVTAPYQGSPLHDLTSLRSASTEILSSAFPKATVDRSKSRCISISGGSLERRIDVVVCGWLDTAAYLNTRSLVWRGIRVLDADEPSTVENFPFLHNARLQQKDVETSGNLKRLIRLTKSIRSDADNTINVSSYDIASICYSVPASKLMNPSPLALAAEFLLFGSTVVENPASLAQIRVPNDTRAVFGGSEGADVDEFKKLLAEVYDALKSATGSAQ